MRKLSPTMNRALADIAATMDCKIKPVLAQGEISFAFVGTPHRGVYRSATVHSLLRRGLIRRQGPAIVHIVWGMEPRPFVATPKGLQHLGAGA